MLRARGNSAGTVAAAMGISIKTVDSHQENIKNKLRLGSFRELTAFALHWGCQNLPPPTEETRRTAKLTPRELEVGELVSQGIVRAEIAAMLGLSARTVDAYLANLRSKLGIRSRGNLVHAIRAYVAQKSTLGASSYTSTTSPQLCGAGTECRSTPASKPVQSAPIEDLPVQAP